MEDISVRGHLCEGLKKFQESSTYSCIPRFTDKGYTSGCDDTNYVPLIYCPFCGEKLPTIKKYIYKCKCGSEWESYEKDSGICEECYERVEPIESE